MQSIIVSKGNLENITTKLTNIIAIDRKEPNYSLQIENDPDISILNIEENKKMISIVQIRDLIKDLHKAPFNKAIRTIIIYNAESLTIEAQNALLKTLEEPPLYIRLILIVNHHKNLLDTVVSRCVHFELTQSDSNLECNSEYEVDNALKFLDADIGQRIDMIINLKVAISNRETAALLIESWIIAYHKSILVYANNKSKIRKILKAIKMLNDLRVKIRSDNLNSTLAFEYFAVNV